MLREFLPGAVNKQLFGDREKYGCEPIPGDSEWRKWQEISAATYNDNQRRNGFFDSVNNSGYRILERENLAGKHVLEIGPGHAHHLDFFQGQPALYTLLDRDPAFLLSAEQKAKGKGIPTRSLKLEGPRIPLPDESQDLVLSFYSLEHLCPLEKWLDEFFRVLKVGGKLMGAIPAEGGIAWGLGRWLTNRPYFKKNYGLDLDKIICWEHVNFGDTILDSLKKRGESEFECWPVRGAPIDLSLIIKFSVIK